MDTRFVALTLTSIIFLCHFILAQELERGSKPVISKDRTNQKSRLWNGSYALIIGNSEYSAGWTKLNGVKADVQAVRQILSQHGFTVEIEENLKSEFFEARIKKFINNYGFAPDNRLLIYYSGHGYTTSSVGDNRVLGYIIPADTPSPAEDLLGFKRTAVSMETIIEFAKRIEARHALFVFDSCFSGKLFVTRGEEPKDPTMNIFEKVAKPVRMFITAGDEHQTVPDESVFRKAFIDGLEGEADTNRDNYITGIELAEYLQEKVTNYSKGAQTPQYGKIQNIDLAKGDFVFVNPNPRSLPTPSPVFSSTPNLTDEIKVWDQIKDSTDPHDFATFIKFFPNGSLIQQAQQKWEEASWKAIPSNSSTAEYNNFLEKFPNGRYAATARLLVKQRKTSWGPAYLKPGYEPGGTVETIHKVNARPLLLSYLEYPKKAIMVRASGTVEVQVTIDEVGGVISAKAISGHVLLRQVSEQAALASVFDPTFVEGKPVKITGSIIYNFTPL